ncbi:hypothetical protein FQA39_LY08174 [Lamprigera yunnana]|nr:hypothetical protein FQA39_LY08174 [Lamprigera yunnana]
MNVTFHLNPHLRTLFTYCFAADYSGESQSEPYSGYRSPFDSSDNMTDDSSSGGEALSSSNWHVSLDDVESLSQSDNSPTIYTLHAGFDKLYLRMEVNGIRRREEIKPEMARALQNQKPIL